MTTEVVDHSAEAQIARKDQLALTLATLAILVSSFTAYRTFLYVKNEVLLMPVGFHPAPTAGEGSRMRFVVVNSGNRYAAVTSMQVLVWKHPTTRPTQGAFATYMTSEGWVQVGGAGTTEIRVLAPGAIYAEEIRVRATDVVADELWSTYSAGGDSFRLVSLGIALAVTDGSGKVHRTSSPIGYLLASEGAAKADEAVWFVGFGAARQAVDAIRIKQVWRPNLNFKFAPGEINQYWQDYSRMMRSRPASESKP